MKLDFTQGRGKQITAPIPQATANHVQNENTVIRMGGSVGLMSRKGRLPGALMDVCIANFKGHSITAPHTDSVIAKQDLLQG